MLAVRFFVANLWPANIRGKPNRHANQQLPDSHTLSVVILIYASDAFPSSRFGAQVRWGRFFKAEVRMRMSLDVQARHALVDGLHTAGSLKKYNHTCMIRVPCWVEHPNYKQPGSDSILTVC
jgi:hypothetical protein